MKVKTDRQETRLLGWYAIQRTRFAEWIHARADSQDGRYEQDRQEKTDYSERPAAKKSEAEGKEDQNKEEKKKDDHKNQNRLEDTVREAQDVLAHAKTVFPFTLFPDTITIDRHKLTILHRRFVGAEQAVSVPIENIKNIQADVGPIFGSLTITSDHFINNTQTLDYLRRDDVKKIQKLVQGITMATSEGIDISEVDSKQLNDMLMKLGEGHTEDI